MSDGFSELDDMIARIERMPELAKRAAPDAADAVRDALEQTIKAGTDPNGKPWEKRKLDGGTPLTGALKAIGVGAIGTRVFVRLRGIEARHHLGRAKGGVYREVIPVKGIPRDMQRRIKAVLADHFEQLARGV